MKKLLSIVLLIAMLLSTAALAVPSAVTVSDLVVEMPMVEAGFEETDGEADLFLESKYTLSDSYKSGKYYTALCNVNLTGNEVTDIINVAFSQEGYCEGSSSSQLDGETTPTGNYNYTEYGRCHGNVDGAWCAYFVSWCARQAGISTNVISSTGGAWLNGAGFNNLTRIEKNDSSNKPKRGDLIFFDWYSNGTGESHFDHVEIVYDVDNTYVYSIGGNSSSNNVKTRKLLLTNGEIKCYGRPNYTTSNNASDRIEDLKKLFPSGSFFSVNGQACSHTSSETCSNCNLVNVLKRDDLKDYRFSDGGSWTCLGFAKFAWYFIHGKIWSGSYDVIINKGTANKDFFNQAVPGDMIYYFDASGNFRHAAIFCSAGDTSAVVYHANTGGVPNKVNCGSWSYSSMASNYGSGSFVRLLRIKGYVSEDKWSPNTMILTANMSYIIGEAISTGGEMDYYEFTPTQSGKYAIYSTDTTDTQVYLYDVNGNELANDDDSGDGFNFSLTYDLTAGTKYIYGLKFYDSSLTGDLRFTFGHVYTVNYNANGGTGAPESQLKLYGKDLTLSDVIPTRTGYTFKGWSTSASGSVAYASGATYSSNSSVTLYAVWEQDYIASGTCGDNLTWVLENDGTLKISGNGRINRSPWYTYKESIKYVIIEYGVTYIGVEIFDSYKNLESVVIPNSVTEIDDYAFYACEKLTKIEIPDSVTVIGQAAFSTCVNLEEVSMPNHMTEMRGYAFYNCRSLKSIVIPDGIPWLGATFEGCTNLETVKIPNSVISMEKPFHLCNNLSTVIGYSGSCAQTFAEENNITFVDLSPKYTVSYNANGGSGAPSAQTKVHGTNLTLSNVIPTRDGYTFLGWSTTQDNSVEYEVSATYSANSDVTLYAVWEKKKTCHVYYYENLGTGIPETQEKIYDENLVLSTVVPTRENYSFVAWGDFDLYDTMTTEIFQPGDIYTQNHDITLFPIWKADGALEIDLFEHEPEWVNVDRAGVTHIGDSYIEIEVYEGSENRDAAMYVPYLRFNAADYRYLIMDATVELYSDELNGMQVFFTTDSDGTLNEEKSIWHWYVNDEVGNSYRYVYDMSTVDGWDGTIECLRIDPFNGSGKVVINSITLTDTIKVDSVVLDKSDALLVVGDVLTLTAEVAPSNATNKNVTWSSTNENVATVANGTVTAIGEGTATITVTTEDGSKTASCTITVNKKEEPVVNAKAVFTFSDVTGRPGETIDVKVSLKTEEKINTIVLSGFEYDKDLLTFEGFYDYDHITDMSMLPPTFDENKMAVAIALSQNQTFDGDICTLKFTINPEAPDGALDKISAISLIKLSSLEISSKVVASNVTVRTRLKGDIDGDEDVDIDDAVALFQHSVLPDIYPLDYIGNIDFDKNGSVDIDDAVLLFQYSVLPDLYPID
ncbi:MAG: InlB B-repeat-containing protein [Lachnospira sp.]|nr:InlB B-repeat-containing protein [Lachnospira sp.]